MSERLTDCPNWKYLLQEFDVLYRHGSAGGSKAIRSHRKRVRDTLSAIIDTDPFIVTAEPIQKPVTAHLSRALDLGARSAVSGVARALGHVAGSLAWTYGYPSVPKPLSKKYAYAEILGPNGPVQANGLVLGFVLFAPGTTYPQHAHQDIEESYVSVAGAWSENDSAVYAPGSLILNRSGVEHRITTGEQDPCLLAYAWFGPAERLATPGMKFSARRPSRLGT